MTILEWSKLQSDPLQSGVVEVFGMSNPVLERMPFQNIMGNAYRYNREGTLPGIAFRGINESYTESTGIINPVTETLTICGGDSDYDVSLVKMGVGDNNARAAHDAMKSKALSLNWLKTFFDGDSDVEPREFDGLNKRLTGGQHIQLASGGAVLTLDDLDQLIDAVEGTPDVLLMSKTMRRKVNALMRAAGQAQETVSDTFGRQIQAYAGIPIGIVEEDDTNAQILAFDEDDGSGNLDTASIYALRFGMDALMGIQTEPMDVRDLGELDTKPAYRTRIEWYSGLAIKHPEAAARLSRINNA
ncbi:MAG: major capsid protein [Magnetospiraceae bacterium]